MADKIKWGILGPGDIARTFAKALSFLPDAQLLAVGSRTKERADKFGDEFNVPHRYGSYQELVKDPDVDVIYVATIHPSHKDCSLLALNAGKAVLCEKPFTINAAEAKQVIDLARKKKLFLMEAMWTRFLPAVVKVREWLASGAIGEVRLISIPVGFRSGWNPEARDLNINLGGGALLDMGCYTIAFASMIMGGPPEKISSMVHIGETHVDEQNATLFGYKGGALGIVVSAVRTSIVAEAHIYGTNGRITVHHSFWCPTKATLTVGRKQQETVDMPFEGNGYNYEAAEVMRCMREGKLESAVMPLDESLSIMKTADQIRAQWGLKYPTEKA